MNINMDRKQDPIIGALKSLVRHLMDQYIGCVYRGLEARGCPYRPRLDVGIFFKGRFLMFQQTVHQSAPKSCLIILLSEAKQPQRAEHC